MKVLFVSDSIGVHTKRWIKTLTEKGIEVVLYTLSSPSDDFYLENRIKYHFYNFFKYKGKGILSPFYKINIHKKALKDLKKVIKAVQPDILHAHYTTNKGMVAPLSGFHPFILSIWSADVYDLPKLARAKRNSFRNILKKADVITSSNDVMADEISKYTNKNVYITPLGVNINRFKPGERSWNDGKFKIGIVKDLLKIYGIDYLIRAFKKFYDRVKNNNIVLEIVGRGEERNRLARLVNELGISDQVVFRGFVDNDVLPDVYRSFDMCVFLSLKENSGVAAIEAMACGCPVITSDANGFKKIVENGVSGIIVPRKNVGLAAEAMFKLYSNEELRHKLSVEGRKRVEKLYDWNKNVDTMISIYENVIHSNAES